jgi:hypothetical protein
MPNSEAIWSGVVEKVGVGSEPGVLQIVQEATAWPDSTCMGHEVTKLPPVHALQSDKRSHVTRCGYSWDGRTGKEGYHASVPPLTGPAPL